VSVIKRGGAKRGDKLKIRQKDFDQMRSEGGAENGKWVKTEGGKNQFFIRPGSNKK